MALTLDERVPDFRDRPVPLTQTVLMAYNIFGTLCKPQCLDHKPEVL
jgi:hypothetical protein